MTKIGKRAAQDFFGAVSKVFDTVKTVALWSAKERNVRSQTMKMKRMHRQYFKKVTKVVRLKS
jgi:hypothetical protein